MAKTPPGAFGITTPTSGVRALGPESVHSRWLWLPLAAALLLCAAPAHAGLPLDGEIPFDSGRATRGFGGRSVSGRILGPGSGLRLQFGTLGSRPRRAGSGDPFEQIFVFPRPAGKKRVRWSDFSWRRYDYLGAENGEGGGVRLYFYDSERVLANRAAHIIRAHFHRLREAFSYDPSATIPYILYNSHGEFRQNNLFPISENVLGVTSPQDLTMALPYWGDHQRFQHVSAHELVHQFTIQKVNDVAARYDAPTPLLEMPLWFIEGLAEFYSIGGFGPEAAMFARDILLNPAAERGYRLPHFLDDRIKSFVHTYKLGQARVAFIAETYGREKVQALLEESFRMSAAPVGRDPLSFSELLHAVLGEKVARIDDRYREWLRRRAFAEYLETKDDLSAFVEVQGMERFADSFVAVSGVDRGGKEAPIVLYRTINPYTGVVRLVLTELHKGADELTVASDGHPDIASLHYFVRRTFTLGREHLAYAAERGGRDVIYVHRYSRGPARRNKDDRLVPGDLELGDDVVLDFGAQAPGLLEISNPIFSPEEDRIAFIGLDAKGNQDIYYSELRGPQAGQLVRLTEDVYSEREIDWGPGGLLYSSDRTGHRKYNIFLLDPDAEARSPEETGALRPGFRLTFEPHDHQTPRWSERGQVIYTSYAQGRSDLYVIDGDERFRATDFATGLFEPYDIDGTLYAMAYYGGRFRPVKRPMSELHRLTPDVPDPASDPDDPWPIEEYDLPPEVPRYDAFDLSNWKLQRLWGFFSSALFGQVFGIFGERMNDRSVVLELSAFGDAKLIDGVALYFDRGDRVAWGVQAFHQVRFRRDRTFNLAPDEDDRFFLERSFGVMGILSYPFSAFTGVEGRFGFGGVERFDYCFGESRNSDDDEDPTNAGPSCFSQRDEWRRRTGGAELQTGIGMSVGYDTLRYTVDTGPLQGATALLDGELNLLPQRGLIFGAMITDVAWYQQLFSLVNFSLRGAAGTSFGGRFGRQFFISSFDNFRGYNFGDDELLGAHYVLANAELQFPLNAFVRLFIVQNIEGVIALDVASVFDEYSDLADNRAMAFVVGNNFRMGPFIFKLHWGIPIDIGGPPLPNSPVVNFSLRLFYQH